MKIRAFYKRLNTVLIPDIFDNLARTKQNVFKVCTPSRRYFAIATPYVGQGPHM